MESFRCGFGVLGRGLLGFRRFVEGLWLRVLGFRRLQSRVPWQKTLNPKPKYLRLWARDWDSGFSVSFVVLGLG